MPHINRIRVNNVKYNFGTQFYDDFIMRFDGKNVLYDLANGGGKSVLLLLLLQNLIPNCTLDDKQPVEKLFRGTDGSTVIHSLIEWKLDDYLIEDDYRYMLTGFCARKAKDDEGSHAPAGDAASIEYFNYVIFYRNYNDNDLVNLPLSDGKERVTFPGLKQYLKNLGRKDYSLKVYLFERKGEYQHFISHYGLYESEWEIIRGINKTEGHVRAYFEGRYKTTRKVVEDLLIEEIIQNAFAMRTAEGNTAEHEQGDTEMMADTLYAIKDQLSELTRRKEEMHHYDRQQEVLGSFGERIQTLNEMYAQEEMLRYDMAKTYQTAKKYMQQLHDKKGQNEQDKQQAALLMEDYRRKLDTVRIQSNREQLQGLDELADDYKKQNAQLTQRKTAMRETLFMRQSMNDYLDYQENQRLLQAILETIRHADSGQQELQQLLWRYTSVWKSRYENQKVMLAEKILEQENLLEQMANECLKLEKSERESDRMLAVLEHRILEDRQTEQEAVRHFGSLRDISGLLILEDIEQHIAEQEQQIKETEAIILKEKETITACEKQLYTISILKETSQYELQQLKEELQQISDYFVECEQQKQVIENLFQVYQIRGNDFLKQHLLQLYRQTLTAIETQRRQIVLLEERMKALNDQKMLSPDENTEKLMQYLQTNHGIHCVFGADYIKSVPEENRKQLLDRIPMLPYAVIVKNDFGKLAQSHLLEEKDFGENLIPVTDINIINGDQQPVDGLSVIFAGRERALFMDDAYVEKEKLHCRESLDRIKEKEARLMTQLTVYEHDLETIRTYEVMFGQQIDKKRQEKTTVETKIQQLNLQLQKAVSDSETAIHEKDRCGRSIIELEEKRDDLKEKCSIMMQLLEAQNQLNDIREQLLSDTKQYEELKKAKVIKESSIADLHKEQAALQEQHQFCTNQQAHLENEWQTEWQHYDVKTTGNLSAEEAMSDEELLAAFMGAKAAFEKEHMNLNDKHQLMESYRKTMERLLKSIGDRGQKTETFEKLALENGLFHTDDKQIQNMKEELWQLEDAETQLANRLAELEAERNRLYGSVTQAVTVIEEKYGTYQEVNLNEQSYDLYIQNVNKLLETVSGQYTKAANMIERLTKDIYYTEGLCRDMERMMRSCQVPENLTDDTYGEDVSLRQCYDDLFRRYEHMQMDQLKKREAFEKDKAKTAAILHGLGAQSLAAEMNEHMMLPENAADANRMITAIEETITLIGIEKERVAKNMEGLLSIKQNFENQCLQICLNIKNELEKLPKMSTVLMDHERIQMLGLTIPYIKENFYKEQMATYIDDIVNTADHMTNHDDKMRYIRKQLAWKRLFAVIVSDMNAIRLTLYKRERIREQSRYLKYEEAVGSTGQSQGIYIQFLIAIIHYISCIHAGTSANEKLKKVIFIDNPFGAAKDIYIWEPIFALLKTNDVQLIVPARGATPAITGKFDVNYVLGQKLMENRQQTIVADYYSNVVIDEMEYVKMAYEQQVLDFV